MFESLSEKLQSAFERLKGKGKLSEKDVASALREVKLALLEADVNFRVVKQFVSRIEERAVGKEVLESLTPAQQVIKIVNEELTELMGEKEETLNYASEPPTIIMLVGLQGSGKTTTAGKLAKKIMGEGHTPLLVAADVYRPAAIRQLQVLGEQLETPVFSMGEERSPVDIVRGAEEHARSQRCDTIIVDTAGRLHVDEELMQELEDIKEGSAPDEILLVVDSMTGQDAVNAAQEFEKRLGITGVILTKLDGDARGGAALSIKQVTGRPIKFTGTGEKLSDLEVFHPERMSSRILGMGDMLSLIEKAEQSMDQEKARELEEKIRQQKFTLEDFMGQMEQIKQMGPLDQVLGMLPGAGKLKNLQNMELDDGQLDRIEAIISSMTMEERRKPEIINGSRRRRIAQGSGTRVQDVNRLLKQFKQTQKLLNKIGGMQKGKKGLDLANRLPF